MSNVEDEVAPIRTIQTSQFSLLTLLWCMLDFASRWPPRSKQVAAATTSFVLLLFTAARLGCA